MVQKDTKCSRKTACQEFGSGCIREYALIAFESREIKSACVRARAPACVCVCVWQFVCICVCARAHACVCCNVWKKTNNSKNNDESSDK